MIKNIILAVFMLVCINSILLAQVPARVNFQGVLMDNNGNPLTGSYNLELRLHEGISGGTAIWTEMHSSVPVNNGVFNIILGNFATLSSITFDKTYYVEVKVGNDPPLQPRVELTNVPYSFMSKNIEDNTISTNKIQNSAVTTPKISDNSITTPKIMDGAVTQSKLAGNVSLPPGGTAGGDLTGSYPNPTITANAINTTKMQDQAVTNAKIANGTIGTEKLNFTPATLPVGTTGISDGAVTESKLATNSVSSIKIQDNSITTTKIQDGTITGNDIANNTIGTAKLNFTPATLPIGTTGISDGAVTESKLATNSVSTIKIQDNSITTTKIQDGTITGNDIANNTIGTAKLNFSPATLPITTSGIQDGAVTNAKITNGTIGTEKLNFSPATLPIGTTGISDNAISTAKIQNSAVTNAKIANGTIGTEKLNFSPATLPIGTTGISDNAISTAKIQNSAVTTAKIQDQAVTGSKISVPLLLSALGTTNVLSVMNTTGDAILTTVSTGTGIRSQVSSSGVAGRFLGGTGAGIRVENNNSSTDAAQIQSLGTGNSSALYLWNNNSSMGYSTIYAWNNISTGYSGYFRGRVHVDGILSKSSGTFKIDHPLDPSNKFLNHSFVESPDMMNVYNGNVVLDGKGEAIVVLPNYFESLNMDYRYQLTPIGAPGPNLYIANEISNNSFSISGGTPNSKVSWQVTGVRNDPYAQKNRIIVEENKNPEERGKYLNPEAYNMPQELGITYQRTKEAQDRIEEERR